MTLTMHRFGQGAFNGPTTLYSISECPTSNNRMFRPLGNAHGLAIMGDEVVGSHVTRLLFTSSPTAVLRRVIAVVINSIKCHAFWRVAHISYKVIESVPATAYANSSAAIAAVTGFRGVIATLKHRSPYLVNRLSRISVGVYSTRHTPTRLCVSAGEVSGGQHDFGRTFTEADPEDASVLILSNRHNRCEFPKGSSGKVFRFVGDWYNFMSHLILHMNRVVRWRVVGTARTPILPQGVCHG